MLLDLIRCTHKFFSVKLLPLHHVSVQSVEQEELGGDPETNFHAEADEDGGGEVAAPDYSLIRRLHDICSVLRQVDDVDL